MKVLVLIFEGWKFLFLFFNVEGSYFCSSRLKVIVFALVGWTFIFVFGGWRFLIYVSWNVYFHILNKNDLKKSLNLLKSWFVKCDLQWWRICEGRNFFDENYRGFYFCLNIWIFEVEGWIEISLIFSHTCYFCLNIWIFEVEGWIEINLIFSHTHAIFVHLWWLLLLLGYKAKLW